MKTRRSRESRVESREWMVESRESRVEGRESRVERAECSVFRLPPSPFRLPSRHSTLDTRLSSPRAFTLVELLVTVVIIGIMAGIVLGALQMARQAAREAATKATIAKLNTIIMQRYESYMTRRVPIQIPRTASATLAAQLRLYAIRDLMRMEMPDARADIMSGPATSVPEPALHKIYFANQPTSTWDSAQCLYKVVSIGSPEAMEQFNQSEIGVTSDGKPVFVDGWKNPICWLRWAPGYSSKLGAPSDIQTGDAMADSDPFDPRRVDPAAFHMIPLICSGGSGGITSLAGIGGLANASFARSTTLTLTNLCGTPITLGSPSGSGLGCTTNHHIEQR